MKTANSIFKTFFLSLCIIANTHFAYGQTASILPPAKTTFVDQNGKPLTSGTVDFYIPSTTTRKTTWRDAAETVPNANPVVLDSAGRALILGSGSYRQVVKDRNNNTIWDQVTSSTGSGSSSPTATGDGDLVGTIKPWAGMTAPNQYLFTYGQEVSRTTYAALFTAITSSQSVFCNSGSAVLTGLSDTTNFWIGMTVEISCVAATFSTVVSKTTTTVTLAANANVTTNTTATFFPWGRGNGTTTFNLPDFRGFAIAGNNNMGGVAGSQLTTTYFGATDPNSSGAAGGNQSKVLLTANLPAYTPTGTNVVTNGAITINNQSDVIHNSGGGPYSPGGGSVGTLANNMTATQATTTSVFTGVAQGGTSTALSVVQPTKTSNYIIKVTPDDNSATASGVTSLGGMTGSIACGNGLLCTGNNISVTPQSLVVNSSIIIGGVSNGELYNNAGVLGNLASIVYDTRKYGIVCDGVTVNTSTQFTNVWNDAVSTGGVILFPIGTCVFTSIANQTLGSHSVAIKGQGIQATTIKFTGATDGFNITYPTLQRWSGPSVSFYDLSVQTTSASGGAAIHLLCNAVTGVPAPLTEIDRIQILQDSVGGHHWTYGLQLDTCSEVHSSDIYINGDNNNGFAMTNGIRIQSASSEAVNMVFHHTSMNYISHGFDITGHIQGITINDANIIASDIGLYWSAATAEPGLLITGSDFSSSTSCISLTNISQFGFTNNICYVGQAATVNGSGISLNNLSQSGVIEGNIFVGFTSGGFTPNCIVFNSNSTLTSVNNNNFQGCTTHIVLAAGSAQNKIGPTNIFLNGVAFTDAGTGNIVNVGGFNVPTLGVSGAIPYWSSTTTQAASGLLTANNLMIGGGAGAAPSTVATGTGVLTALGINVGLAGSFLTSAVTSVTPGGGLVSSVTAACSQSAITTTGTLSEAQCINAQSGTSYAIVDGDRGKLITASNAAAQAYSIAQAGTASAFQSGWYVNIENNSTNVAGIVTITPTTSQICAQGVCAATYKIQPGQFARIGSDGTNYQVTFNPIGSQLPGTATNDAANAGNIGELIASTCSNVALTSTTTVNCGNISLTPGEWSLNYVGYFVPAATTTVTDIAVTWSTVNGTTFNNGLGFYGRQYISANTAVPNEAITVSSPTIDVKLSATTTYFANARATFGTSTNAVYGLFQAQRVR